MDSITQKRTILLAYVAFLYGTFMVFTLISSYFSYESDQWSFFYYYSNQTNILVTAWLLLYSISVFRGMNRLYHLVTQRVILVNLTVYMAVVYLIVIFILDPLFQGLWVPFGGVYAPYLHVFTPIVMWMYFFLVPGHGSVKPIQALYVYMYAVFFLLANFVIGATVRFEDGTAAYAYDFLNPNNYASIWGLVAQIVFLVVFFGLFSLMVLRFKGYVNKAYYGLEE